MPESHPFSDGLRTANLNILFLIDSLDIDGITTYALSLARQLKRKGYRVIVAGGGGFLQDSFRAAGIETVLLPFQCGEQPLKRRNRLTTLASGIVVSEQIDLIQVHFHCVEGLQIAARVATNLDVPLITTVHGLVYPAHQLQKLLGFCEWLIAVSHPVARWLTGELGAPHDRTIVVPNGIDVLEFTPGRRENRFRAELGVAPEDKLMVICGRLAWAKSRVVAVALESLKYLADKDGVHVAVVGGGPDDLLIRAMATVINRDLNRDAISMVGWLRNPLEAYRAADVVIGTARVALEAMSCGRPVIAAGNAGYVGLVNQDMFEEAWETYLGDHRAILPLTSQRLRSDLEWILERPDSARAIGDLSRQWVVENFAIERIADQLEKVYCSVLHRTPVPAELVQAELAPVESEMAVPATTTESPVERGSNPITPIAIPASAPLAGLWNRIKCGLSNLLRVQK